MARPAMSRGVFAALAFAAFAGAPSAGAATPPSFGPLREVLTLQPGAALLDLANGDFSGDGRQDVLVVRGRWASLDAQPISILTQDTGGGFSDRAPDVFSGTIPTAVWPRQELIGDFNEDGRDDIFIGDSGMDVDPFPGHTNHLLLSVPDGKYADASATGLPQDIAYFHSGAIGDVDGDHHLDILLADLNVTPAPLQLLLGDGHGNFTPTTDRFPVPLQAYPYWFTRSALVDVDGDGDLDAVLLAVSENPTSIVLLNDGHGAFTGLPHNLPAKPFGTDSIGIIIQPVELNGDTHPDLLLGYTKSTYKGRWIQVAINNGDGTFRDETAARLPQSDNDSDWPYNIVLADMNSDGAPDFGVDLGANFCCSTRRVVPLFFLNRGDGTFEQLPASAFAQDPYGQFRLIDVNGDGLLDVFSAWEAGPEDALEHYAVSIQGDTGATPTGGGGGTTQQPPPPPPPPGAELIAARHPKLVGSGKRRRLDTGIDAVCPAGASACSGKAALATSGRKAHSSRLVRLLSARLSLPAGTRTKVTLLLPARARHALAERRRPKIQVDVTVTGPNGSPVSLRRIARLKLPRKL